MPFSSTASVGSSVTLIFYKVGEQWWKEPALNLIAAVAQHSSFTHVEIAIGEDAGGSGQMKNVLRIFNDPIGAELTERTGRNPLYMYLSLGCSKAAEQRMLAWAKKQVGKPFSNIGMARSIIMPRKTDETSWFCAELVAACLRVGGLMSRESNPGAATPFSLYKMYSKQAAAHANPYTLRSQSFSIGGLTESMVGCNSIPNHSYMPLRIPNSNAPAAAHALQRNPRLSFAAPTSHTSVHTASKASLLGPSHTKRAESPPKASFRVLNSRGNLDPHGGSDYPLSISLAGLNTNPR